MLSAAGAEEGTAPHSIVPSVSRAPLRGYSKQQAYTNGWHDCSLLLIGLLVETRTDHSQYARPVACGKSRSSYRGRVGATPQPPHFFENKHKNNTPLRSGAHCGQLNLACRYFLSPVLILPSTAHCRIQQSPETPTKRLKGDDRMISRWPTVNQLRNATVHIMYETSSGNCRTINSLRQCCNDLLR